MTWIRFSQLASGPLAGRSACVRVGSRSSDDRGGEAAAVEHDNGSAGDNIASAPDAVRPASAPRLAAAAVSPGPALLSSPREPLRSGDVRAMASALGWSQEETDVRDHVMPALAVRTS